MARTNRKGKARRGSGSPDFIDPALFEIAKPVIDALLAHPEYCIVSRILMTPSPDEDGAAGRSAGSLVDEDAREIRDRPIAYIAGKLRKSRRLVLRQFFEITGLRLRDVIVQLAMKRVAIALRTTTKKVDTIAHEEGYTTGSALGRRFTEFVGVTPIEYRSRSSPRGGPVGEIGSAGDVRLPPNEGMTPLVERSTYLVERSTPLVDQNVSLR